MKGASKPSSKAKAAPWASSTEKEVLYDSQGSEVHAYGVVDEESSVGENYEYGQEQQGAQQQYEHAGPGREWRSWADAAEWIEEHKDNTDYVEDYPEEKGGNRWTSTTGKGKGQTVRGQSRPPAVRVASPPKEEDVHY